MPVYRLTRGRVGGHVGRAPVLLLTTRGRRSGQRRTTPVVYIAEGSSFVVIGSNAGNNEPAWALNLRANGDAEIEVRTDRKTVRARLTDGDERRRLWDRMNAQYAGFEAYEARTSRDIPVFLLEPAGALT